MALLLRVLRVSAQPPDREQPRTHTSVRVPSGRKPSSRLSWASRRASQNSCSHTCQMVCNDSSSHRSSSISCSARALNCHERSAVGAPAPAPLSGWAQRSGAAVDCVALSAVAAALTQ